MASATPVRDWATVDYYALLGITPSADADEVTRAFRAEAKRSHPDATNDPAAAERFSDVAAAYAVLGDARTRREYDRVRAEMQAPVRAVAAAPVTPTPARRVAKPWSRRKAWTSLLAGALVTVLGIGAVVLTWTLHEHDAHQRARFVPVVARRIDVNGSSDVSFLTRSGERITVAEPHQHGDPTALGPTTRVRYDPANPEHVIVDGTNAGRDITFSIVALKFLIGGPVFVVLGARKLRGLRRNARP